MASGQTIDSLNIEITTNSQQATQGIKALSRAVNSLSTALTKAGTTDFTKGLQSISNVCSTLQTSLDKLDASKLENLATVLKSVASASRASANTVTQSVQQMNQAVNNANSNANSQTLTPATQRTTVLPANTNTNATSGSNTASNADGATASTNRLAKALTALRSATSTAKKGLSKLSSAFNVLRGASNKATGTVTGGFKTILKYVFGIRSMLVLARKIRNGFIAGSNNLVQYSSSFNQAISSMHSALIKLKNAFAVAFAPIIEVVAPYITYFINLLSKAMNMLGQFFGAMLGKKSVAQATDVWEDYGKSVSGASSATKKLLGLQNFDKLNNLSSGSSGSGSGSGTSLNASDMFTTEEIDSSVKDFVDKIKQAWNSNLSDLESTFENFGFDFGTAISNSLDKIKWNDIKKNCKKVATSIAGFINGFVKSGVISTFGKTLAQGINTALTGIDTLLTTIKWKSLGTGIMKGITTFFGTLDWSLVGKTIVDAIIGAIDFVTGLVDGIDWASLPKDLATAIYDILSGANWSGLFKSTGALFGTILKACLNLAKGIDEALADLKELLLSKLNTKMQELGFDKNTSAIEAGKMLITAITSGILEAMKNIGTWLYNNVVVPLVTGIATGLGIDTDENEVSKAIKGAFSSAFASIEKTATDAYTVLNAGASAFIVAFKTIWAGVEAIKTTVSTVFNAIKKTITTVQTAIKTGSTEPLKGIKDIWVNAFKTIKSKVTSIMEKLATALKKPLNACMAGFETMVNGVIGGINNMISLLNKLSFTFPDWIPKYGGKKFGLELKTLDTVTMPRLATGGVVNAGQMFIANEQGAELVGKFGNQTGVMNNQQIIQAVAEGVYGAVSSAMANSSSNITVSLEGDAEGLFRMVRKADNNYRNMNGHSAFVY